MDSGSSNNNNPPPDDGELFLLFRRKVQNSELLSASTVKLAQAIKFTGRLTVVLQNGQTQKSNYAEGYFRRKEDWNY